MIDHPCSRESASSLCYIILYYWNILTENVM
nr:MAG TPA: hypothetical protein [Caudoviricetes sp.]